MLGTVPARLSIGEFSKMTYLSVKALRHYHDVGLLEPASIDPSNGYRFYEPDQVATAQAIRRFRDLDMPLDEIAAVVGTDDLEARNRVIAAHLDRLETSLDTTRRAVESLRDLLTTRPEIIGPIRLRSRLHPQDDARPSRAYGRGAELTWQTRCSLTRLTQRRRASLSYAATA